MEHLTKRVLEGLKGQNFSVSKAHPKSGKPYEKKLAAQQMALLLTVASHQESLPRNECGEASAWTADPKTICAYTHTGPTAFHEDRNFLVELGLLERVKSSYRVCTGKLRNTESTPCEPPSELRNTESATNARHDEEITAIAKAVAQEIQKQRTVQPPRKRRKLDHGGKGTQTKTKQDQLSAFQAWMLENNYSPDAKYVCARNYWFIHKAAMEKAKNAEGQKKGYSSYKTLANAYWNALGNCKNK